MWWSSLEFRINQGPNLYSLGLHNSRSLMSLVFQWVEKNVCEEFQWACKYGVTWLQGNHYENLTAQKMECVSFVCIPSPTMNEYKIHKAMDS
ncbi:hypothetical protein CsatB_013499 [Cannabis sativa]